MWDISCCCWEREVWLESVLGVARSTLYGWLGDEVSEIGHVEQPHTVTGTDGKEYPATRPTEVIWRQEYSVKSGLLAEEMLLRDFRFLQERGGPSL